MFILDLYIWNKRGGDYYNMLNKKRQGQRKMKIFK